MLKIDYLYCGDGNHDKIYAAATNDTHTVFIYGSRTKGSLKSSIQPASQNLHVSKINDKLKRHGDGTKYEPTTNSDIKSKVDAHLHDIKFTLPLDTLSFSIEDQYYGTCTDNTHIKDYFETGLDYLILEISPNNITVIDKFGEPKSLLKYQFDNFHYIK